MARDPSPSAHSPGRVRPPRLAERLLAAVIRDPEWRDSIVGDLREEFAGLQDRAGLTAARRWYWRQACAIGARRMVPRSATTRRPRVWAPHEPTASRHWRTGMSRDLRYAWRAVVGQPGTSAVIVVTLALALATNSVSFALLDAIVLRPFRFPAVDRVVMVVSSDPQAGLLDRESVTRGDFADWRRETKTVAQLSAAEWWDANLSGIEQPEQIGGYKVTADFFAALGAIPPLGRSFVPEEETPGSHRRVVLGHALWQRLFAGDPAVIGKTVRVDGEAHEVVGVAPPSFSIPEGAQIWAPLAYSPEQWADRRNRWLITVGRLRDGTTIDDARAEMAAIAERQRRDYPETNTNVPNTVVTFTEGMQDAGARAFLSLMLAASGLLLLIACANIANLLLARGSDRIHEFALRMALGGGRGRLAAQLMLEAGMLTAVAVALALPLAALGLAASRASIAPSIIRFIPGWNYLAVSPTVFLVTALFGVIATVVFALLPALNTVRSDVADTLRQGARTVTSGRQRNWLRNSLAAAQVAITLALVSGSGLMLTAVDRAVNGVTGFDKQNLLAARVVLPDRPYEDAERRRQFIDGVLERMRAVPAVTDAAMVSALPYAGGNQSRQFWPEGIELREGEARFADYRRVTPEYFETMDIPLLTGRGLNAGDRAGGHEVAVVSRALAERYWPDGDAVGRRFRLADEGPWITVVGVVGDVLHDWFLQRRAPTVYRPLAQDAPFGHAFVIRTVGDPLNVAGEFRRAVSAMDADQPILMLQTMNGLMRERTSGIGMIARMLMVVAVIAFGLAVMGLYSLMTFIVSRRTQELGVRLALGATRWQVIAVTLKHGAWITASGLVVGVAAAAALGRLMESALYGVVATDLWQLAALVLLIAGVAAVATYLPARRTATLNPTAALRAE
jgi:putative ABC transport system permease protein